jgi:hypothetical protein
VKSASSSTWEVGISSASVVAKRIKQDLVGSHASQASLEALAAEVIRVVLWAHCTHDQKFSFTEASVTTRRLLELARAIWAPLSDASQEGNPAKDTTYGNEPGRNVEIGRELLDTLAEQGDIFALSGGHWLPTPLRFVPVTLMHHLLVGGMPTHLLPHELFSALRLHGSFRHVEGSAISSLQRGSGSIIHWQYQSLHRWLGAAQSFEDLNGYFDGQELLTVAHQYVSETSLEAYVASDDKPQRLRWRAINQVVNGRYLLKTSTPWGAYQYSIGLISNRMLTNQSVGLWQIDIRRLCYALDKRAGKPTSVRWKEGQRELVLRSELPGRERKFLSSVGTLQENTDGSYYPRRWIIAMDVSTVLTMLQDLGIQIEVIY